MILDYRMATSDDADSVADVYLQSRKELVACAPLVHSDEDVRRWIRQQLIPAGQTTVAVADGRVVGLLALSRSVDSSWIDQLYVLPAWVGRGIGSRLVALARSQLPPPIRLYTFQCNERARRFYESHGFKAIAFGDGHANEERCPDMLYEWGAGEVTAGSRVRAAEEAEIDHLARIWYDGWQDAHAPIMPAELAQYRTLPSFRERLRAGLSTVRVAGPSGQPVGFCMVKDDELYQLYVAASARGSGVAAALLADGEARLAAGGVKTAWLACAIGNDRAAKFYAKNGWRRIGTMIDQLEIPGGLFPVEVWRYEKDLPRGAREAEE